MESAPNSATSSGMSTQPPWKLNPRSSGIVAEVGIPTTNKNANAAPAALLAWRGHSAEDAELWLRTATPERALDPVLRLMVGRTRRESTAVAMEWALAIDAPKLRR